MKPTLPSLVVAVGVVALFTLDLMSEGLVSEMPFGEISFEVLALAPLLVGLLLGQSRRPKSQKRPAKTIEESEDVSPELHSKARHAKPLFLPQPRSELVSLRPAPPKLAASSTALSSEQHRQSLAISRAVRAGNLAGAEELVTAQERGGMKVAGKCYGHLIAECVRANDLHRAWRLLDQLSDHGPGSEPAPFNAVMDAFAKRGEPQAVERVFEKMVKCGLKPNVVSYSTLVYAHAKAGKSLAAESCFRQMVQAGVKPNVVTYDALIISCVGTGNFERIETLMQDMETDGVEATVTTYTTVLDACAKANDVARGEQWYERMQAKGIKPNVVTFTVMIDLCARIGDTQRAAAWLRRMLEAEVKPNTHTLNALIKAYIKANDMAGAEQLLNQTDQFSVQPVVQNYSTLISAMCRVGDREGALRVLARMEACGVQGNSALYTSVMGACCPKSQGDAGSAAAAQQIFDRMVARNLEVTMAALSMLARAYSRESKWQEIEKLKAEAERRGLVMNSHFVTALLLAYKYGRAHEPIKVEALFREAVHLGIEITEPLGNALAKSLGLVRASALRKELGV